MSRFLGASFFVIMLVAGIGLVVDVVTRFQAGTAFQRYKNWQGLWISYGEAIVFVAVAWVVGIVGAVWSWLARKREEASFMKKYRKDDAG